MTKILVATSNHGKLGDFAAVASVYGVSVLGLPDFDALPEVAEDGSTFEANARKKAEFYSNYAPRAIVLADDSGLEVDALQGAPGVHSARYAATEVGKASDSANNAKLLKALQDIPPERRSATFVAVITAAQDGKTLGVFRGEAHGVILPAPQGDAGFGYDPLFLVPDLGRSFAELTPEEKAAVSHRGQAFRKFLDWFQQPPI